MERDKTNRPKIKKGQITSFAVKNNSIKKNKYNKKINAPILAKFMSKNNQTSLPLKKQKTFEVISEERLPFSKSPSKNRNASLNEKKKLNVFDDEDNLEEYEQVPNFKKRKRSKF